MGCVSGETGEPFEQSLPFGSDSDQYGHGQRLDHGDNRHSDELKLGGQAAPLADFEQHDRLRQRRRGDKQSRPSGQ